MCTCTHFVITELEQSQWRLKKCISIFIALFPFHSLCQMLLKFHFVVVQQPQKNVEKAWCIYKVVVLLFWTLLSTVFVAISDSPSPLSLLKLPVIFEPKGIVGRHSECQWRNLNSCFCYCRGLFSAMPRCVLVSNCDRNFCQASCWGKKTLR